MLGILGDDAELVIYRDEPTHAQGYLATWPIGPEDSPVAIVERLASEFGGRVFRLQPVARVGGKKQFVKGGVRVRVAGEPRGTSTSSSATTAPAVVSSPSREQSGEGRMLGSVVDVLQKLAERLGAVEARVSAPPPPPPTPVPTGPGLDLLAELRKVAELRKLARELVDGDDEEEDEEDEDDDERDQPRSMEDRLLRMVEKHIDKLDEKPAAAASSSSPRLIRNGVDVTPPSSSSTSSSSTSSAPASSSSTGAVDREESGAEAVARKIASLGPERAVAFLFEVQAALPDEVKLELARLAGLAEPQTAAGG